MASSTYQRHPIEHMIEFQLAWFKTKTRQKKSQTTWKVEILVCMKWLKNATFSLFLVSIPSLFFFIFVFSMQLTVNKIFNECI